MSFRKRTTKERLYEIIPGAMFWLTLFFALFFSRNHPVWVSVFIILFDLYWLFKAINGALHLLWSYRKYRLFNTLNWLELAEKLGNFVAYQDYLQKRIAESPKSKLVSYFEEEIERINKLVVQGRTGGNFRDYYHVVLYPFVDEGVDVLETTLHSLQHVNYPKDRIIVILASEERAGAKAAETAAIIRERFAKEFFQFFVTVHPDGLPGEIKGKSANASFAMQAVVPELEKLGIPIDNVLVSNFDSDTMVHREYFARVSYEFITAEKPYRSSYQPIAVYNNNIWDSPALIRLVSVNNTFFQFIESSRPNRLRTFSSHTMTLRALVEIGYWRKDLVNEDGYVYWQCYFRYNGDYMVVPLFISVSLDTCLADTYKQTLINQYKQKRRWAYNVEYYPSLVPSVLKTTAPWWDKAYKLFQYIEGNYNWATASIVIAMLGWLPLILGGDNFGQTVVAQNLPFATRFLMTLATAFLICSVYINLALLPPRPKKYSWTRTFNMYAQWIFVPVISVIFGALPAVEAQTRLMLGRYMEFWVTPKHREVRPAVQVLDPDLSGGVK